MTRATPNRRYQFPLRSVILLMTVVAAIAAATRAISSMHWTFQLLLVTYLGMVGGWLTLRGMFLIRRQFDLADRRRQVARRREALQSEHPGFGRQAKQ